MNVIDFASRASAAAVAGVAGFSSYSHIVEVARRAGEHPAVAAVLPLSIDGLIVAGTMAMVADKRADLKPRLSARVALAVGVVATLAANIASAQPTLTARLVAAVPAMAFLITVEVLARVGRKTDTEKPTDTQTVASAAAPTAPRQEPVNSQVKLPVSPAAGPVFDHLLPIGPERPVSLTANAARVIEAHRQDPTATNGQLAERLSVSVKTVERYRPARAALAANGHVPHLPLAR